MSLSLSVRGSRHLPGSFPDRSPSTIPNKFEIDGNEGFWPSSDTGECDERADLVDG